MSSISCPIPDCDYSTGPVEAALAVALLNIHANTHTQAAPSLAPAAVSVKCPIPNCTYATENVNAALATSLLQIHAKSHEQSCTTAKVEKVRRPIISASGTSEEWKYFLTRWSEYAKATCLTGNDCIIQLLECCDEPLRKDLTRSEGGSLFNKTEEQVLDAIKQLAVREENAMVARVALHNMTQDREEPIRSFCARIKGQASVCKYNIECPSCKTPVDYTKCIIRDVLSRGLSDNDIQLELLGHTNQDMTLEQVVSFIESKEAGKRSAMKLSQAQGIQAIRSAYKQSKSVTEKKSAAGNKPDHIPSTCGYCGRPGHAREPAKIRQKLCPAYGHSCTICGKLHHMAEVCRSRNRIKTSKNPNSGEGAIFDILCHNDPYSNIATITSQSIPIDHHIYSDLHNSWVKRPSKPQPFMKLKCSVHPEDYANLKLTLRKSSPYSTDLPVMADTGCQSCLAGMNTIQQLGLSQEDLLPVTMTMTGVSNDGIPILGAAILRFSGKTPSGDERTTRQLVYVTNTTPHVFLNREGCAELGMISHSFPTIGDIPKEASISCQFQIDNEKTIQTPCVPGHPPKSTGNTMPCGCPLRQKMPPKPKSLPFEPTDANRENLQQWLINYYRSSAFNMCKNQPLILMDSPPMRLMIDPSAHPTAFHNPLPVPLHWQEEVKAGLDQDVKLGVIEPVPIGDPVTWCHRMVVIPKKNGNPRRTVDFQPLNTHATRETHHTVSPFHQARSVPANTKKTVLDAWNGYHSVPLHEDDRHLTTFITPWGRYRYRVAPQGYIASGDSYTRRYDEIIADFPQKTKCVDDTLLWEESVEKSIWQTIEYIDLCGRKGITFNIPKFVLAADKVEFAGFDVTPDNVSPCHQYLQAILDFPKPQNITDIRSWFGLLNQVSYAFSMTSKMQPFRALLQPKTTFKWTSELDVLFEESKHRIVQEIKDGVKIFDKSKPTCLATDWSKDGIGFWLFQKHCECTSIEPFCCLDGWMITLVGSRFTSGAESRYAPVEGEALAVADALDKARFFVLGCEDLILAVDHKPLLKILGNRSLDEISNGRLRNLKERTLRYRFRIVHVPGVRHKAADTISRRPTGSSTPSGFVLPDDIAALSDGPTIQHSFLMGIRQSETPIDTSLDDAMRSSSIHTLHSLRAITWDRVRLATSSDDKFTLLMGIIQSGMPDKVHNLPPHLREYHQFRHHLYSVDGVIMYKERILVPPKLRPEVLNSLHAAHQGASIMQARAESSVFWPGITADILSVRSNCTHCNKMAPSQPSAPPIPIISPVYPFQCVCTDFFTIAGIHFLVLVDRYSNWPVLERTTGGAQGLVNSLRRTFVTYGIPDELASDGGPEFTSSLTEKFLDTWGVHHRLSSVAFPHSNCRAEIGVKTMKRLLADNIGPDGNLDTDRVQRAILQYRNAPDPTTKVSPAMCLFGRPIKDFVPIFPGRYKPHSVWTETLEAREEALRKRHMLAAEKWSEHTKRLPPLIVGDHVHIQNQTGPHPLKWDKTGRIIEVRQFDQYVVRTDGSGRVTLRNRKFLRKFTPFKIPGKKYTILDDIESLKQLAPKVPEVQHTPDEKTPDSTTKQSQLQPIPPAQTDTNISGSPNEDQELDKGSPQDMPLMPMSPPPDITPPKSPSLLPSHAPDLSEQYLPTPDSSSPRNPSRILKRLDDYNKPGLKETAQQPRVSDQRIEGPRRSTRFKH